MSITVGHTTFDRVRYDADTDVLYLHVGDPNHAVDFDESPEGHALRYDGDGMLVGITIVNAKQLLEDAQPIVITIPERVAIDPAALAPAVQSAA
ncbi:MAG: DUF2283 domain-containing protein [Acidimicrobiia bacterium]|nr:DUF2283 domain-containing protein [Acidimicrobiia bacterium]